jgi:hypothetical protein
MHNIAASGNHKGAEPTICFAHDAEKVKGLIRGDAFARLSMNSCRSSVDFDSKSRAWKMGLAERANPSKDGGAKLPV